MIYFLRAGERGHVKIGYTRDERTLQYRIKTLQTGQPAKIRLLRIINGPKWVENWFKEYFSELRLYGECFSYREDMLSVVPPDENPNKPKAIDITNSKIDCADGMPAEALIAWRNEHGLSKIQLAKMLGISRSRYDDYELGFTRGSGKPAPIPHIVELALCTLDRKLTQIAQLAPPPPRRGRARNEGGRE